MTDEINTMPSFFGETRLCDECEGTAAADTDLTFPAVEAGQRGDWPPGPLTSRALLWPGRTDHLRNKSDTTSNGAKEKATMSPQLVISSLENCS